MPNQTNQSPLNMSYRSKESIREWMKTRQATKAPLPSLADIREQLYLIEVKRATIQP